MPGINSGSPLDLMKGLGVLSLKDVTDAAGVSPQFIRQIKSGKKALGPHSARAVAAASSGDEKAANLYLVTQATALKSKIRRGRITPQGVAQSLARIGENVRGGFQRHEFDRSDAAFKSAQRELHEIGESVLDILGDEPQLATKSADEEEGPRRDLHGRAMPKASEPVQRDFYGRKM